MSQNINHSVSDCHAFNVCGLPSILQQYMSKIKEFGISVSVIFCVMLFCKNILPLS